MILRRLADAIREQNWFTVGIEFLIVVSGIFVGLQVDDWNEARQKAAREQETISRMHAEAVNVVDYFNGRVDNQLTGLAASDAFVRALSGIESDSLAEDAASRGYFRLWIYPSIAPPRAAFDELSSSGLLNEISDSGIRTSIADYYRELDFIQGQLDRFRVSDGADPGVDGGVRHVYDPESPTRRRYEIDFERLAANPSFISGSVQGLRNQIRFTQYYLRVLRKAGAMCLALAEGDTAACPDGCVGG